tara:strand:+ start:127 stop:630 length:504 start_codon:yes stop_codon:yes gene_type:complete
MFKIGQKVNRLETSMSLNAGETYVVSGVAGDGDINLVGFGSFWYDYSLFYLEEKLVAGQEYEFSNTPEFNEVSVRKFIADLSGYATADNNNLVTLSNIGIVGRYKHARKINLIRRNVNGYNIMITPKEDAKLSKLQKEEENCFGSYCKAKGAHAEFKKGVTEKLNSL